MQTTPPGMTHWSCRVMAQRHGVSKSTISEGQGFFYRLGSHGIHCVGSPAGGSTVPGDAAVASTDAVTRNCQRPQATDGSPRRGWRPRR